MTDNHLMDISPVCIPSLYCTERAVISVAIYLNRDYGMAFFDMYGLEYRDKDSDALQFAEKIHSGYSDMTIVRSLAKYHGITSCFLTKNRSTVLRAVKRQIDIEMPVLIFLDGIHCTWLNKAQKKVGFFVVGYMDDVFYGYDLESKETVLVEISAAAIKESYDTEHLIVIWKTVHDEVKLTYEAVKKNIVKKKYHKLTIVNQLEKMVWDLEQLVHDNGEIHFEELLAKISDIVRGRKLFAETCIYIREIMLEEYWELGQLVERYITLGQKWNLVWRMLAMASVLVTTEGNSRRLQATLDKVLCVLREIVEVETNISKNWAMFVLHEQ